jgi:hypothetical protein
MAGSFKTLRDKLFCTSPVYGQKLAGLSVPGLVVLLLQSLTPLLCGVLPVCLAS